MQQQQQHGSSDGWRQCTVRCVGGDVTDVRALWEWEIAALVEVPHSVTEYAEVSPLCLVQLLSLVNTVILVMWCWQLAREVTQATSSIAPPGPWELLLPASCYTVPKLLAGDQRHMAAADEVLDAPGGS